MRALARGRVETTEFEEKKDGRRSGARPWENYLRIRAMTTVATAATAQTTVPTT